ncbi:MAG: DUF192 domain-containing protein [Candidatus Omnitrophota bacterium]
MVFCRNMGTVLQQKAGHPPLRYGGVPTFVMQGFLLILVLILLFSPLQAQTRQACVRGVCVQVEVVDSPEDRSRGLMFRDKLGEKEGMLFIFDERGRHNFWMKNMQFPIDIIWINQDKVIVDIRKNIPPCKNECPSYTPQINAKYVLEVNAGFIEKNKIGIGDRANF